MKIITISGVDGSGKTTVSNFISKLLKERGFSSKVVHLGFKIPLVKDPDKKRSKSKSYLPVLIKDLSLIYYLVFSGLFYDYLIFDRYIDDTLVKIKHRSNRVIKAKNLVPKPGLSIFLDLDYKISFMRDRDYDEEFHRIKAEVYRDYFRSNKKTLIIDANKDIELLKKQIKYEIESRIR